MRPLNISFGSQHFSYIDRCESLTWDEFAARLSTAVETTDKASAGWYACAAFADNYRDEEHMGPRECLTFDFDHIKSTDVAKIEEAYASFEYVLYTTHSHLPQRPRLRMVLPLSRPATPDEFRAVSRSMASLVGIELVAPESHKPAQFMFMPAVRPGTKFRVKHNQGSWTDVDGTLATYQDWTDRKLWPVAKNDSTYKSDELPTPAREKPGIIGAFNRTYTITQAIEEFKLPYEKVSDTRWTYTQGSRPEGARTYDDDTKLHSENGTDPARGQHSAFDLVRLHRFGHLDVKHADAGITERPSFAAMVDFARSLRAIAIADATSQFDYVLPAAGVAVGPNDFGAVGEGTQGSDQETERSADPEGVAADAVRPDVLGDAKTVTLARPLTAFLKTPTKPRWLIKDELERGVIALLAGPRGSFKSFKALDWAMRVAQTVGPAYVVSGEGGDLDRRARAWVMTRSPEQDPAMYVIERRLDLNSKEGIDLIRQDCVNLGISPVLFVLDTFSKLSGGLDENDNTQVKQFIGRLDNGLKRADTGFDATVLLVAHTGHSDKGRARGASALGADTDAEYIVRRHQNEKTVVFVSRERFKASAELPPLIYEPQVVPLGYADDEGREVTSLVLNAIEAGAAIPQAKLSEAHQAALVIAYQMLAEGNQPYEDIIEAIADTLPPPVGTARDTRIQIARRRFDVLEKRNYVRRRGTVVTKSSATEMLEGDES